MTEEEKIAAAIISLDGEEQAKEAKSRYLPDV